MNYCLYHIGNTCQIGFGNHLIWCVFITRFCTIGFFTWIFGIFPSFDWNFWCFYQFWPEFLIFSQIVTWIFGIYTNFRSLWRLERILLKYFVDYWPILVRICWYFHQFWFEVLVFSPNFSVNGDLRDFSEIIYWLLTDFDRFQVVGLAVISLGNCWRLTGCNDVATHITIAEHYSIYYTKLCSVCYVVQLYESILTYTIQLAWNLAMSFDEGCTRG